ncbi:MAG: PsbP-related protein [Patescibacteria group bacterium]
MTKQNFLKIFIIFFGAVMISATGYTAWKINKDIERVTLETSSPNRVESQNKEPETIESEVNTSDWKVYKNEEYGFEVRYPKDWVLNYRDKAAARDAIITLTSPQTKNAIETALQNKIIEVPSADISFYVIEEKGSLYTYFENRIKMSGYNFIPERKEFSFNGYDAFKIIEGGFGQYFVLYIKKNNKIYRILFENRETEKDLNSFENQIISSFKFID